MKRLTVGMSILRPLVLGILAGGLGTFVVSEKVRQREAVEAGKPSEEAARQMRATFERQADGLLDHFYDGQLLRSLCYMRIDDNG